MTQPGPLERIAAALETIAAALAGGTPAARTPRRPDTEHARFGWEPDPEQAARDALPEPALAVERCGFLIEQYIHPLDRATLIYQISKSGASLLVGEQEAARLAALGDEEFTADLAVRLAEVLAQRHRENGETGAVSPEPDADAESSALAPDADDEEREAEWASQAH